MVSENWHHFFSLQSHLFELAIEQSDSKHDLDPSPWKRRKTTSSEIFGATGAWGLRWLFQIIYSNLESSLKFLYDLFFLRFRRKKSTFWCYRKNRNVKTWQIYTQALEARFRNFKVAIFALTIQTWIKQRVSRDYYYETLFLTN